jgi:ABC-type Mn2+/Zn2+ transport system permease subunit
MIEEFLASWPLFRTTYLAGWLIAVQLALVGVWVVARNQIFLGVAVAQASTLGIAAALWAGSWGVAAGAAWLGSDAVAVALAVGASIATALLTAREPAPGRESAEALTGWVYLLSASLPVLLLAQSPHGLEEIHHLIFSTILGASSVDLQVFAVLAAATLLLVARFHRRLLLFALDPEMAAAGGLRRGRWNAAVALWLGLAVGLSIRVSGTLYTFGCLVLPALIAKNLSREIRPLLLLAPALALLASGLGFVLANHFDVPPAHATVALLCLGLLAAWTLRAHRRRRG